MPWHVLISDTEIITSSGRRRRWFSGEKLRIVEEALEDGASISEVARRNGVAANPLYRWRRLVLDGGAGAVSGDDDVTSQPRCPADGLQASSKRSGGPFVAQQRIRALERQLGRKTLEVEILKGALDKSRSKRPIWLAQSQPKGSSR